MTTNRKHLTLIQKALILVAVPLAFELVLLAVLGWLLHQSEVEAHQADTSKAIISKTNEVIELCHDVGIAFIIYDAATKPFFEDRYVNRVGRLRESLDILQKNVEGNEPHLNIVKHAREEIEESLDILANRKKLLDAGGRLDLQEALGLQEELKEIVEQLNSIIADEKLAQETRTTERSKYLLRWVLGVIVLSIIIALAAAVYLHRGTSQRLRVLMENSLRLGAGRDLAPKLEGDDEIGQIDRVFHQAAFLLNEAARKERAVVDNAVDVICSIDASGNFVAVSPAAEKLWGYRPSDLFGRNWLEIIHREDAERVLNWEERLRLSSGDGAIETRVKRADESLIDMRWSASWSPAEQSMFCVVHDISERLEMERFKQQFVAMISHDLRTPLTAVQSTLELLGMGTWGELTDKGQLKVSRAEDNLRHTINLINNLLDLEKMQSGKIELVIGQTEMEALLKRCVAVVAPLAESRSIEIEMPQENMIIDADSQRLAQVVINLLGNAIKFSPLHSKVVISMKQTASSMRIAVEDKGPGIPADRRDFIFQPYHQLPAKSSEKQEGTGLGLAICKAIVEAHNGEIGVESAEGQGSSFWFTVPLKQ